MTSKKLPDLAAGRRLLMSVAFKARCEAVLSECLARNAEIDVLSVSAVDGRNVVCVQRAGLEPARIAALSATLMSVSESLAKEVNGDGVDHALLSLRHGVVVSRRLTDPTGIFTLSVVGRGAINLALALRIAIDAADTLVVEIESEVRSGAVAASVA